MGKNIISDSLSLSRINTSLKATFSIVSLDVNQLLNYRSFLHPEEKKYLNTLKFDKRKTSYLQGRMAAKGAIAKMIEVSDIRKIFIDFGVFNFPVVKLEGYNKEHVQVSISHCEDIGMALAFQESHPMGLDIEHIDEKNVQILKNYLSLSDLSFISSLKLDEPTGYTLLWTIKESLSKVLKTGLSVDFNLLRLDSLKENESVYIGSFSYFAQYKSVSFRVGPYMIAIALPKNTLVNISSFVLAFKTLFPKYNDK